MTIAIATPIRAAELRAASVSLGYSEMMRVLARELPIELLDGTLTFSADVARARNRMAGLVLRELPRIDGVLWIDDDQFFEDPNLGPHVIRAMLATGEDVIGLPYTNKRLPLRWIHQLLSPCPTADARGVQSVRGVGFGMTYTSTHCLKRMASVARKYTDHPHPHVTADMFSPTFEPVGPDMPAETDLLLSEDFSFCKRWRDLGGKVKLYCKSGIVMHAGGHAWSAREIPNAVVD